jgi:hypothetical protein
MYIFLPLHLSGTSWEIALGITIAFYVIVAIIFFIFLHIYYVKYKNKSASDVKKDIIKFLALPVYWFELFEERK